MLVRSAWTGPPAPACNLALAGTPAQPRFAPLQEKNIRRLGGPWMRWQISPYIIVRGCGNIYYLFNFRSYLPVSVQCCGNVNYISGHIYHVNVCRCQFFGHVHQFWSYSFSHLDSVKWITIILCCNKNNSSKFCQKILNVNFFD